MIIHYVTDKWDKSIVIETATIGKLKALLAYMEGMVYHDHKSDSITDMISFLPDEYGIVMEELAIRKAKPYISFYWVLILRDKKK